MHPRGQPLIAEFKKSDGIFSQTMQVGKRTRCFMTFCVFSPNICDSWMWFLLHT